MTFNQKVQIADSCEARAQRSLRERFCRYRCANATPSEIELLEELRVLGRETARERPHPQSAYIAMRIHTIATNYLSRRAREARQ